MRRYTVRISKEAQNDIYQVINHISTVYKAPLTAEKFLIGLYDALYSLENSAGTFRVSTKSDILRYGLNARSIAFKKLTIVYTVHGPTALVRAVISGALIKN